MWSREKESIWRRKQKWKGLRQQSLYYDLEQITSKQSLMPTVGWPRGRLQLVSGRIPPSKITRRERPKSAPYLRLKDSKRISKCQSIGELGTLLWKKIEKKSHNAKKLKGIFPFGVFQHSVGKYQKIEGDASVNFFWKKVSQRRKKLKGGPFGPIEFLRWCKNTTS